MKIVNFKEFLDFPAGTVYMKYMPCAFEDLCVKEESLARDFLYSNIANEIDCTGSDDFANKLFHAEELKEGVAMDFDNIMRDGCFDENQLFAIYERQDVEGLITKLGKCFDSAYDGE